jgi:hypothetical protein
MSTQYFHHIHLLHPFLISSHLPLLPIPGQDLFYLPVLLLKKDTFVYDSYTGSFVVPFPCVYVIHPELVHPLYFSLFYLTLLLMVISTGLKILCSFLNSKFIYHIHLLSFLLSPSLSLVTSPSRDLLFTILLSCVLVPDPILGLREVRLRKAHSHRTGT